MMRRRRVKPNKTKIKRGDPKKRREGKKLKYKKKTIAKVIQADIKLLYTALYFTISYVTVNGTKKKVRGFKEKGRLRATSEEGENSNTERKRLCRA